jgi:hypothetical protein
MLLMRLLVPLSGRLPSEHVVSDGAMCEEAAMSVDHKALFDLFIEIHNEHAWDRLGEVFTDDYVEEYPQSGEVFRGLANVRAVRAAYPGLSETLPDAEATSSTLRLAANDEAWVVTPMFIPVRVEGTGNVGTAIFRMTYPDGSRWWNVHLYEVRGGRLAHAELYFAPEFEPPDWRASYR